MSPALAGGFFTTEPAGKPSVVIFKRTLGKAKQELGGGRWGGGWRILNPGPRSLDSGCEQACHTVKCL